MSNYQVGFVFRYFREKGYGFIGEKGNLLFFHITQVEDQQILRPGQKVTYTVVKTRKGDEAREVTPCD